MKKLFTLFAVGLMALSLSGAELNIFASGLKAVQDGNKVNLTYVLNANATAGEIQLLDAEGAVVKSFAAPLPEFLTKGSHTIDIDLSEAGIPAGTYNWAVKVTAAATEALTQVTATAEGSTWVAADSALIFYAPRGLAINTNPENANFGLIYVSSPNDGAADGGSTYSKNHKKGLYVINPDLTLVNDFNVPYLGGISWMGTSSAVNFSPHRLALDADGALYLSGNNSTQAGVWKANTADLTANFTPVTTATNLTGISGITVVDGVVYGLDNVGTGATNSQLVKITASAIDTIAHLAKLGNANCSLAADGKGGFWVFQNRWGADAYDCLFHVTATGEKDWSAVRYDDTQEKYVTDYLPFTANISYRGAMAVNKDYTKLIVGSDKSGVVFDITWADGKPDLKEAYRTPQLTNNIDGVGFDYAENIYILSAGVERLYAFAPVKADNTCVTPAPKASTITVAASAGPKVWNIAPDNNPESPRNDCNLYVTLARVAGAGDTIILADGEYIETISLPNEYDVVIKAAEGAHPVIKASGYIQHKANLYLEGIKFVFVGETDNGYAVYSYDNTHKNLVIENCEFTAYTKYVINASSSSSHVDSCIINNCFFHDNSRAAVYYPASSLADNVHACDYLKITNTTIANVTSSSISGYAVIDIRNNNAIKDQAEGTELIVDHVTLYNFPTGGNGGIMNYKSKKTSITNTIIAAPTEIEQYATYCYGGEIKNNLTYNLTKGTNGHKSGPTFADNITGDPLFADAANGDYTLSAASPALKAGTDGSNLGDPRWWPAAGPVVADGYYLIGPDWTIGDISDEAFAPNPGAEGEYMLSITLTEGAKLKVVEVKANAIVAWYPDGMGNEYTVDADHAGEVTIYFRPTYQNDWAAFGGYFYIAVPSAPKTTLKQFYAAADKTNAVVLEDLTVTYVSSNNIFVVDAEGTGGCIYDKESANIAATDVKAGSVISGLQAKYDVYNAMPEIIPAAKPEAITEGEAPAPVLFTVAPTIDDACKFIKVESATVTKTGKNFYIFSTVQLYDKFKLNYTVAENGQYDFVGIVIPYAKSGDPVIELCPTEAPANTTTAIDDLLIRDGAVKIIENGQVLIIRDGKRYNMLGAEVK